MAEGSTTAVIGNFLAGVSRALFIFYTFFSPFFIEDELRRVDKNFNIAKIFLPLLALIKLFFGFMHIILKSNSKEVTKLLITMIFLSAIVLHSNFNSNVSFKDIYFDKKGGEMEENAFLFLSSYIPYLDDMISWIPSILDNENKGVGMTANVAEIAVNSTNLVCYHWIIIIGIVSSICCHMIAYKDYSRIGRLGLGIFYILYGISIMILTEFQRPWIYILSNYNLIDSTMNEQSFIRILLIISFICCSCGLSLITSTKYKKIGIFISMAYILVLIMYEMDCLLIGQNKRDKNNNFKVEMKVDLTAMLKYHNKYIYPTDYQLIRILNLLMILSGTLFEMLKIYNPQKAQLSQSDYTKVDDDENVFQSKAKNEKKGNKKGKNKNKNKNKNKSEPKKTK